MADDKDNWGNVVLLGLLALIAWLATLFSASKKTKKQDVKPSPKPPQPEIIEDDEDLETNTKETYTEIENSPEEPQTNMLSEESPDSESGNKVTEEAKIKAEIENIKKKNINLALLATRELKPLPIPSKPLQKFAPSKTAEVAMEVKRDIPNSPPKPEDEKIEAVAGALNYNKSALNGANIQDLINSAAIKIASENNSLNKEKVKAELLQLSSQAITFLNSYNNNLAKNNSQGRQQFPLDKLITEDFLTEAFTLKDANAAFNIALYNFNLGENVNLKEVVISANAQEFKINRDILGESGLTIEDVKVGLKAELDAKKPKNTDEELEITKQYLADKGVRGDITLSTFNKPVFKFKPNENITIPQLNLFINPIIRATYLSRATNIEGVEIYPAKLPNKEPEKEFALDYKIFIASFFLSKGSFADELFIDKNDGKGFVLNANEKGEFVFNPQKYNLDFLHILSPDELSEYNKRLNQGGQFSIILKEGYFDYEKFLAWKEQIKNLNLENLDYKFNDFDINLDAANAKFADGNLLSIQSTGRNFNSLSNLFNSEDKKSESVQKYKEDYTKYLINSLQPEIQQLEGEKGDKKLNEFISERIKILEESIAEIQKLKPISDDKREVNQAVEIISLATKKQITRYNLMLDILKISEEHENKAKFAQSEEEKNKIRYQKDQAKLAPTLEFIELDNKLDIKLFDLQYYQSQEKISKLENLISSRANENLSNAFSNLSEILDFSVFNSKPWEAEEISFRDYVKRENLTANLPPPDKDPIMRPASHIGINAGGFNFTNLEGETAMGLTSAITADISAVEFPIKNNSDFIFTANTKGAEIRYFNNGKNFGYDEENILLLPFQSNRLNPLANQRGEFDLTYKFNRFNQLNTEFNLTSNIAQERQNAIISYDRLGLYGNQTSYGVKLQNNELFNNNFSAVGASFNQNWKILSNAKNYNLSAGIDGSYANLQTAFSPNPINNILLLEPKFSFTSVSERGSKITNLAITGQMLGGLDNPYKLNNITVNFNGKYPHWKTNQNLVIADNFQMLQSSIGFGYNLFGLNSEIGGKAFFVRLNNNNDNIETQFGLYNQFNIGKNLINLGVFIPNPNNQSIKPPTIFEAGFSIKRNF